MKNFKVKLMSFFVTIMMMLGIVGTSTAQVFADAVTTVHVNVRVESNNSTIVKQTSLDVDNFSMKDYGIQSQSDKITAANAVIKALQNSGIDCTNKDNFDAEASSYGGYYIKTIDNISASDKSGWMYCVNNVSPSDTMDKHEIKDGDTIVVYYVNDYSTAYSFFDKSEITANSNDSINLNLTGIYYDENYNSYNKGVDGAKILVNNKEMDLNGQPVVTDSNGKCTLKFDQSGTYDISAEKLDGSNVDGISRPYCKITVQQQSKDYTNSVNTLINSMSSSITQNVSDWQALDLNKAGKEVPGSYLTNLENKLKDNPDSLSSPTDYERTSLGVLAAGGDPTNFAGMNLIEKIYNNEGIKDQGINAYVFALIALDAGKFNIPDGSKWTRDSLIQGILDNRTTDGGWSYSGGSADPDMTGMALSALAPYYGTNANVKSAVDGAVEMISKMQKDDGGFASWGTENANSVAMVIIGLCDNNVDPTTDSKFIKNSKNPLDALLSYTVSDNSGFGYTDNKSVDGMATEQGFRALAAYNLFKEGKGSVYKNFTANTSGTKVTEISLDKTSTNLTEGDSLQLIPTITPKDATNTKVDWSSSDKTIAAVDGNGNVTAVKAGTATITAVSEDNKDAKVQCTVTVTEKNTPKLLQITNLTAGSSFKLGDDAKVSVKAENNSGKDQDVSLIVALYNESNKFINYVCGKQTIKNGDSSILTTMMKLPEEGAYKLKAFIWDSLESMNIISDSIDISVQSK